MTSSSRPDGKLTFLHLFVSALSCASILLSGCQAANSSGRTAVLTEPRLRRFSTMDSANRTPSDLVSNHGPYQLVIEPPIWAVPSDSFLNDSSLQVLRNRKRQSSFDAARVDDLLRIVESIREAEAKFGTMTIFDRVLVVRNEIARIHNYGDQDFRMTAEADSVPGLKSDAQLLGLSLVSGTRCSHIDTADLMSAVSSELGDLFPEHGSGRILRIQLVETATNEYGTHTTGTALYLVTARGIVKRHAFLDFLVHANAQKTYPYDLVSARPPFRIIGKNMFLAIGRQNIPLFESAASSRQFVAALVNLLNGLSESEFDELEVSAW